MAWWREARFGMFIHWGLYAVPAGEYNGKRSKEIGEWIMSWANIPRAQYRDSSRRASIPVKFDAATMGADRQRRRHEVHRHHVEASRRLLDVRQRRQRLRHRRLHAVQDGIRCERSPTRRSGRGSSSAFYYSIMDWHHPVAVRGRAGQGSDRRQRQDEDARRAEAGVRRPT